MTLPVRGKRGPKKGGGGRPKSRLIADRDREVIVLATVLMKPGQKPNAAVLKLADMLLSDSDAVDMELQDVVNGVAGVSVTNSAGDDPNSEEVWRTRPLDPSRERQWRSRFETLRRKLSMERDAQDIQWFGESALALEMIISSAPAKRESAVVLLRCLGWRLPPVVEARLSKWLGHLLPQGAEIGVIRTGELIMRWSAKRREPNEVLRVEDIYKVTLNNALKQ
ncbi:MAG: hypothetical protein AB7U61_14160 [Methylocystis sp.]